MPPLCTHSWLYPRQIFLIFTRPTAQRNYSLLQLKLNSPRQRQDFVVFLLLYNLLFAMRDEIGFQLWILEAVLKLSDDSNSAVKPLTSFPKLVTELLIVHIGSFTMTHNKFENIVIFHIS